MIADDPVARIVAEIAELSAEERARCVEIVNGIGAEREKWRWLKRRDTTIREYCAEWHSNKSARGAAKHLVEEIIAYETTRWRVDRFKAGVPSDIAGTRTVVLFELMKLGGVPSAEHIRKHILVGHHHRLNAPANHRSRV
ncbi:MULTISPECIES: hypothetical protein [unclassified Afipia]|uniref:hypothetical protein n=1 Tax=unclassified Afipia TaxID=2642050 RepID=UPI000550E4E7|nr:MULTISPECIES: hypothetical protein [unclassified Afipia]